MKNVAAHSIAGEAKCPIEASEVEWPPAETVAAPATAPTLAKS